MGAGGSLPAFKAEICESLSPCVPDGPATTGSGSDAGAAEVAVGVVARVVVAVALGLAAMAVPSYLGVKADVRAGPEPPYSVATDEPICLWSSEP